MSRNKKLKNDIGFGCYLTLSPFHPFYLDRLISVYKACLNIISIVAMIEPTCTFKIKECSKNSPPPNVRNICQPL